MAGASELPIRGRLQQRLLTLLAVHRNQRVGTDRLIDLLWQDEPPSSNIKAVQVAVGRLRRALGGAAGAVETAPSGYLLRINSAHVDVDRFEARAHESRHELSTGSAAAALHAAEQALAEWVGAALGSIADEPWAFAEAMRLDALRLDVDETRLGALLALGDNAGVIDGARQLLETHPDRESATRLAMLALYRAGRQADALRAFRDRRDYLVQELGLDPGQDLVELEQAILRQDPELRLREARPTPANLPNELDRFVGRDVEIAAVRDLVLAHRLVTLHGAGGSGKTRLATEVARSVPGFDGGVTFVDLAAVRAADQVLPELASVLDVPIVETDELAVRIADRFGPNRTLLLLDNFEQVIEAAADVASLLRAAPNLHALVTSRDALRVRGEHLFEVDPLPVPPSRADLVAVRSTAAVELFVDRASASTHGWRPTNRELRAIADVCRAVDGLPLAIEIAAGLVRVGALPSLATRIEAVLPLLEDGPRDVPPRQRSLRATIAWSRQLLGGAARELFDCLGVFVGGWSLEAAAAVADLPPDRAADLLGEMCRQSLVRPGAEPGRYSMLETIREFAAEVLRSRPDADTIKRRHATYVGTWLQGSGRVRDADSQRRAELGQEQPNLFAALEWALDHEPALAMDLSIAATDYWDDAGLWAHADRYLKRALERNPQSSPGRALALAEAGVIAVGMSRYEEGLRRFNESRTLFEGLGMHERAVGCLVPISGALFESNDFERAGAAASEALEAFLQWGNVDAAILARLHLAETSWLAGNADVAITQAERALADSRAGGQGLYALMAEGTLAGALLLAGRLAEARAHSVSTLATVQKAGYEKYRGLQCAVHAWIALGLGDPDEATDVSEAGVRGATEVNDRWGAAIALEARAEVAVTVGDLRRAATALGAAEAIRERIGVPTQPAFQQAVTNTRRRLHAAAGDGEAAEWIREGRAMRLAVAAVHIAPVRLSSERRPPAQSS